MNSDHKIGLHSKRAGEYYPKPIVVGDGCWVGANSLIMPGVKIADGVIIAAGSVVKSDCLEDYIYAGIPAKPIRKCEEVKED